MSEQKNSNIVWQAYKVSATQRAEQKDQQPCVVWLTGLSGAGKSTLASALDSRLHQMGHHTYVLDGDNVRHGLNKDLGFSEVDRVENIRRVGETACLMVDAGLIVITAFISPFRKDRKMVKSLLKPGQFIEVHVSTPLETCEGRDTKGLYKKARCGQIKDFTGVNSPYEVPASADISIDTSSRSLDECIDELVDYLTQYGYIRKLTNTDQPPVTDISRAGQA
ncbi:adenylyl-sulfate kinase [Allohahella sp. A8]|uniref:adenylyl-sulfate kinase n=1 Tax=Allohahella sp. A8 TaxID=3141461 RepID=UPI000C0A046E|nr:adenylyl-sulfate kinase [Hahellaceae bacterium]|tara:strand:+ start:62227 stop:62892 length:666 start_codon:yes stop_codon:yes gene_type:complete